MKKVNTKDIKEVFKQFQADRHAEDKGRNFNLLQKIYSETELFNLTKLQLPMLKYNIQEKLLSFSVTDSILDDISLPFSSVCVHVEDKQYLFKNSLIGSSTYMFLREYSPEYITGTIYTIDEFGSRRNMPFTISLNTSTIIINKLDYEGVSNTGTNYPIPFYTKEAVMSIIVNVVTALSSLQDKKVLVEQPVKQKAEYFRRKGEPVIKVPAKYTYYILGKNDSDSEKKLQQAHKGKLVCTHTFKVRGHWRRIDSNSVGKDRNGDRVVQGYTWVLEYMKNPNKELIQKVRVLH